MIEVYDTKQKKYIVVLETEDDYISQKDWDKYYWDLIEEEETYLPKK